MKNENIIRIAAENLNQTAGLLAEIVSTKENRGDAHLKLRWDKQSAVFQTEIYYELRSLNVPQLKKSARSKAPFLVVVYRLFPGIKEVLQQSGINYLEANGNLFIHQNGLHIHIDRYPMMEVEKQSGNRAFTVTGLKVWFQLLLQQNLLDAPQRIIAKESGVALGNIPLVLDGLKTRKHIVRKKNGFFWSDKKTSLQDWTRTYHSTLKPTLYIGQYALLPPNKEQNIQLKGEQTCWGGEPGADRYTQFLQPEKWTMYTQESRQQLMKNYKIKPDDSGNLSIYRKFWPQPIENHLAPPLIIYADLLDEPNKRNLEAAQIIWERYLKDE